MIIHLIHQRQNAQLIASENLRKSHEAMKRRHDKTVKYTTKFELGDIVYLYIPSLLAKATSKKLQPTYSGPYMITEICSQHTVHMRRLADGHMTTKPINIERLKKPSTATSSMAIKKRIEVPGLKGRLLDTDVIGSVKLTNKDLPVIKERTKRLAQQRKLKRV